MGTDLTLTGRRADGTEFPVDIALSPMESRDGLLMIAAVRDLTDNGRPDAGRTHWDGLAAVADSSDDAIIGGTLDGIVTSWNLGAERMYGYSREEMVGKPSGLLIPEERTDEAKGILTKVSARSTAGGTPSDG